MSRTNWLAGHRRPDRFAVTAYLHALHAFDDPAERLRQGLTRLTVFMPACDHAAVTTTSLARERHGVDTSHAARCSEELQHLLDEGPSRHALRTGHSVLSHDLAEETRWPQWRQHVTSALHLHAALAVPLHTHNQPIGALTLYANTSGGLSDLDLALLHAAAIPLANTLVDARLSRARTSLAAA